MRPNRSTRFSEPDCPGGRPRRQMPPGLALLHGPSGIAAPRPGPVPRPAPLRSVAGRWRLRGAGARLLSAAFAPLRSFQTSSRDSPAVAVGAGQVVEIGPLLPARERSRSQRFRIEKAARPVVRQPQIGVPVFEAMLCPRLPPVLDPRMDDPSRPVRTTKPVNLDYLVPEAFHRPHTAFSLSASCV